MLRRPGAVCRVAEVQSVEIVPRGEIRTPWRSLRDGSESQLLYRLGPFIDLPIPIENRGLDGEGARFSSNRWTSRLALERARDVKELLLETEPEWRLYEELVSNDVEFEITAGAAMLEKSEDPRGRAWFRIGGINAQFRGAEGFVVRGDGPVERHCTHAFQIIELSLRSR